MAFFLNFLAAAFAVVGWELVKQVGVRFVQRTLPSTVAAGLLALDRLLPDLIDDEVSGSELEDLIRQELGELTGSDWRMIRDKFDPVVFLDNQKRFNEESNKLMLNSDHAPGDF